MSMMQGIRAFVKSRGKFGRERPDPTPLAPPVGYVQQPSIFDIVKEQIRSAAFASQIASQGFETFEEHNDFDVPDDPFPQSPHEQFEDEVPVPVLRERLRQAEQKEREAAEALSRAPRRGAREALDDAGAAPPSRRTANPVGSAASPGEGPSVGSEEDPE